MARQYRAQTRRGREKGCRRVQDKQRWESLIDQARTDMTQANLFDLDFSTHVRLESVEFSNPLVV